MEPREMPPVVEPVDLSPLVPRHGDAVYARVAARAIELRKLRRVVVRRAAITAVVAAAAAIVFWLSAPRRDTAGSRPPHMSSQRSGDLLELGMRGDVDPFELLDLGGTHAQ